MQTFAIIMMILVLIGVLYLLSILNHSFFKNEEYILPVLLNFAFLIPIVLIVFTLEDWSITNLKQEYKIDLPEEISIISIEESKPDTILDYKHGDSLIFKFY